MEQSYLRYLPWLAVILAYLAGMFVDVMEIDAAQYAMMSAELLDGDSPLQLFDRGAPYLDKPPLTFWLSALSYKLFGINTFAFKLPSVLFSFIAIWSLYRLGKLLYSPRVAFRAALILATTQAFFLMNMDVKTDMYLTAGVIFTVWQWTAFRIKGKWWHVALGGLGVGVAMLGKGPLGFMLPMLAIGGDILYRRDWKSLFRWEWLIAIPVIALVILPFCIGLYQQYGGEGVRFFLWDQSFGRLTGNNPFVETLPEDYPFAPFFFVHTLLWTFLPWTLLLVPAMIQGLGLMIRNRPKVKGEALLLSGLILTLLAMTLSRFKLPHYIFPAFPLAALLSAAWLERKLEGRGQKTILISFRILLGLVAVGGIGIGFWAFAGPPWGWFIGVVLLLISGVSLLYPKMPPKEWRCRLVWGAAILFAALNLMANSWLYPRLLKYQSTSQAGQYARQKGLPTEKMYAYIESGRGLDFYSRKVIPMIKRADSAHSLASEGPIYIYTTQEGLEQLTADGQPAIVLETFSHFHVAKLNFQFLDPNSRDKKLKPRHLVQLERSR